MRVRSLAVAALGCLWLLPATASAVHVQCGDTITQDTVLDSDVVCTAQDPVGLVIGANDVKLRLDGYTIQGAGAAVRTGSLTTDARSGVTIQGGAIQASRTVSTSTTPTADREASGHRRDRRRDRRARQRQLLPRNPVDMSRGPASPGSRSLGDDTLPLGERRHRHPRPPSRRRDRRPREQPADRPQHGRRLRLRRRDRGQLYRGIVARNTVTNCDIGFIPSGTGIRSRPTKRPATASASWSTTRRRSCAGTMRTTTAPPGSSSGRPGRRSTGTWPTTTSTSASMRPTARSTWAETRRPATGSTNCLGVVCLPPLPPLTATAATGSGRRAPPHARELQRGAPPRRCDEPVSPPCSTS